MRILTLTFFRAHIPINVRRELFPVVNLVMDGNYPELTQSEHVTIDFTFERTDYEQVPMVLFTVILQLPGNATIKKTMTIDYTNEETVHFFEDLCTGDPFLIAFTHEGFVTGQTKEFAYISAFFTEEKAKSGRWEIELAYTDSTSRNLTQPIITGQLKNWWDAVGKSLNLTQDSVA